jgi:hypothetical protein
LRNRTNRSVNGSGHSKKIRKNFSKRERKIKGVFVKNKNQVELRTDKKKCDIDEYKI